MIFQLCLIKYKNDSDSFGAGGGVSAGASLWEACGTPTAERSELFLSENSVKTVDIISL